jgi:hypothetical protein
MSVGILPAAALLSAGIQGIQGVGEGVGRAVAARQYFTKEDRERLERLRGLEASGQLGLSQAERADLEAMYNAQRGAGLRSQQAAGLRRAVAASQGGVTDARALFLNEMAQQQAEQSARAAQAADMVAQNRAAAEAQRAEMAALDQAQRQRRREMVGGVAQALTGGVIAGGSAAMPAIEARVQQQRQAQIIKQANEAVTETEADELGYYGGII